MLPRPFYRACCAADACLVVEEPDGTLGLYGGIPIRPEQIPVGVLVERIGAMTRATKELDGYMETWRKRKRR